MRRPCSLCGAQAHVPPPSVEEAAATCPLCGTALATVAAERTFDDRQEWLERENPELFTRLVEKRKRRAARRRNLRRLIILAGAVLVVLLAYLVVAYL